MEGKQKSQIIRLQITYNKHLVSNQQNLCQSVNFRTRLNKLRSKKQNPKKAHNISSNQQRHTRFWLVRELEHGRSGRDHRSHQHTHEQGCRTRKQSPWSCLLCRSSGNNRRFASAPPLFPRHSPSPPFNLSLRRMISQFLLIIIHKDNGDINEGEISV